MMLVSCLNNEKEETTFTEVCYTDDQKTELICSYAQILAASMENPEVRDVIKKGTQLKFDGDYDILTKTLHEIELRESKSTVKKALMSNNVVTRASERGLPESIETLVEKIQTQFPNLQVSVPILCDEWDTDNYVPLVAFLPYDYDEHTASEIEAFDTQGNSYMLSLDIEPEQPVVVVSISERVDRDGTLKNKDSIYADLGEVNVPDTKATLLPPSDIYLFHSGAETLELEWSADLSDKTGYTVYRKSENENDYSCIANLPANHNYYIDSDVNAGVKYNYKVRTVNNEGESAYSTTISTFASARNDGESLKIKRMYFTKEALKAVEKWASGAPEIRLRVVYGDKESATTVFTSGILEPKKRNDINGTWWNKSVDITNWCTNVIGTVLTFDWREEDWDDNVSFSIQASYEQKKNTWAIQAGGSVNFKGDEGGDVIGNRLVYYWEEPNKIYDISGFKWEFE